MLVPGRVFQCTPLSICYSIQIFSFTSSYQVIQCTSCSMVICSQFTQYFPTQGSKSYTWRTKNGQIWEIFSINCIIDILSVTMELLKCLGISGLDLFMMALKRAQRKLVSERKEGILSIIIQILNKKSL